MGLFKAISNLFRALTQPVASVEQSRENLISQIRKNPNLFIELINRAKEKIQDKIETIKLKLLDIKKSIAKLSLEINRLARKISLLENKTKEIQMSLKKVRDKIKELEGKPGNEKLVEILKLREKEILEKLRQLNLQIQMEQAKLKQLESQKKELEKKKNSLELQKDKYQIRLQKLDSQKLSFEQAMGLAPRRVMPLQKILEQSIRENARLRETKQVSYGNFAFRATLDSDFNMHNVESSKVLPVFSRVGKETPEFIKQRLRRAAEHGLVPTPSNQYKEKGGRDDYPDRS